MPTHDTPMGYITDDRIDRPLGGGYRDHGDHQQLRWSRTQHEGYDVSKGRQVVPLFFNRWGTNLMIDGQFAGATCFITAGGPSLCVADLHALNQPGIITFGINNSPVTYRPLLWVEVDSPQNFVRSIWLDPKIMKFSPICHANKHLFNNDAMIEMSQTVGDCPNVYYYRRNETFDHNQFLWEDTINWGNHGDHVGTAGHKGCRSVFHAALRICYALGFARVFLVGCDFKMELGKKNYAWDQDRAKGAVSNNNKTYAALNARCDLLRPLMEKHGMHVYNTYKDSGLKSFDFVPLETAIANTLMEAKMPPSEWDAEQKIWLVKENASGLYDREKKLKDAAKKAKKKKRDRKPRKKPGDGADQSPGIALADLKERVG